jgi:hypothetical protein
MTRRTKNPTAALAHALLGAAAAVLPAEVLAFRGLGHRTAGLLAERDLCPAARSEVADLGEGKSLGELGLWADTIRGDPAWERAVPWHYINFPDLPPGAGLEQARAAIDAFHHPPEGDVLTAIVRFTATLADRSRAARRAQRGCALSFTSSSTCISRQHVSRASDGGGTEVGMRIGDDVRSLHGFWDTTVFNRRGVAPSCSRRSSKLRSRPCPRSRARSAGPVGRGKPRAAADRCSFAPAEGPVPLDDAYRQMAQRIAEQRLVLAAARLAATLNGALWRRDDSLNLARSPERRSSL